MEQIMKKSAEFFQLLWVDFLVQLRRVPEFVKVVCKYYPHFDFMKQDLSLLFSYPKSPFAVSKEFLMKRGEQDIYKYGETPLTTLEKIVNECQLSEKDTVFEMGCGRGRTCLWLNYFVGCKVVGIEYIPTFVERANKIKQKFGLKEIEFRQEDFLQSDLTGATVVYLYGSCLEDRDIEQLVEKFAQLPSGTKIVTVSYPVTDYTSKPVFEVMKRFPAQFTWGEGDVFIQLRK
jgi:SAM-dependent methyltransferase